jgi:hypothetical protein
LAAWRLGGIGARRRASAGNGGQRVIDKEADDGQHQTGKGALVQRRERVKPSVGLYLVELQQCTGASGGLRGLVIDVGVATFVVGHRDILLGREVVKGIDQNASSTVLTLAKSMVEQASRLRPNIGLRHWGQRRLDDRAGRQSLRVCCKGGHFLGRALLCLLSCLDGKVQCAPAGVAKQGRTLQAFISAAGARLPPWSRQATRGTPFSHNGTIGGRPGCCARLRTSGKKETAALSAKRVAKRVERLVADKRAREGLVLLDLVEHNDRESKSRHF